MRVFLQKAQEQGAAVILRIWEFCKMEGVQRGIRIAFLTLASLGVLWIGWQSALIAGGLREGVIPQFLPQTLPLLFSGVLYIDRFAAVFGVILSAFLLLVFTEGSRGALKTGILSGVFVLGILAASTPLTLVAWLTAITVYYVTHVAQAERRGFVVSMTAMSLSILLLSGGAFLADMTVVSSVSAQLSEGSVFLALALLFGGALWSVRSLTGAYVLIPVYITLRLCLFFLGGASVLLLSVVSVLAALAALYAARTARAHAFLRSSTFLLFMSVPLTMLAVQVQVIDAVQCFLFGGLAIVAAGMIGGFSAVWPVRVQREVNILLRFLQSALPGTFMGTGALLLFMGFVSLGQLAGPAESLYLLLLAVITFCTLLFLSKMLFTQTVRTGSFPLSGVIQAALLVGGAVFFAHMLTYLGTTIGGDVPDAVVEVVLGANTFSFTPWILFVGSAVLILLLMLVKRYQPKIWDRVSHVVHVCFTWLDAHVVPHKLISLFVMYNGKGRAWLTTSAAALDDRSVRMGYKERALLLFALFIVTLIVLF